MNKIYSAIKGFIRTSPSLFGGVMEAFPFFNISLAQFGNVFVTYIFDDIVTKPSNIKLYGKGSNKKAKPFTFAKR
jgi:hypothetical protein